jgi:hypothetical protein
MMRKLNAPEVSPETQPFWDAAAQGKLLVKQCNACAEPHYYPRALCPHCLSADTRWVEAAGTATIYSLSTMRRGPDAPFTLAYVTLDDHDLAVLTNIATDDHDALFIGQRVRVQFAPTEGAPYPMFAPTAQT